MASVILLVAVHLQHLANGQITLPIHPHPQIVESHTQFQKQDLHNHGNAHRLLKARGSMATYHYDAGLQQHRHPLLDLVKELPNGERLLERIDQTRGPRSHYSHIPPRRSHRAIISQKGMRLRGSGISGTSVLDMNAKRNLDTDTEEQAPEQSPPYPLLQGYGSHYVTLWVGTPPQRKSVIIDTGSSHTAFPCKGCKGCGLEHHTDWYFHPKKSKTFKKISCKSCNNISFGSCNEDKDQCEVSQTYGEGSSWNAYMVKDKLFLGSNQFQAADDPDDKALQIDFQFGCQTHETGLFIQQLEDGIMGLVDGENNIARILHSKNKIPRPEFSLCLGWKYTASARGVHSGIMSLGGVNPRVLHETPMVYVKRDTSDAYFYHVNVRGVYMRKAGGLTAGTKTGNKPQKIELDQENKNEDTGGYGSGMIVDSGTTDTSFDFSMKEPIMTAWKKITGRELINEPQELSAAEVKNLPTILVQLVGMDADNNERKLLSGQPVAALAGELDPEHPNDVILSIPATHYMEYNMRRNKYTNRIEFKQSGRGTIGANAMQGHDFLFDLANDRIGIAESNCDYDAVVDQNKYYPDVITYGDEETTETT